MDPTETTSDESPFPNAEPTTVNIAEPVLKILDRRRELSLTKSAVYERLRDPIIPCIVVVTRRELSWAFPLWHTIEVPDNHIVDSHKDLPNFILPEYVAAPKPEASSVTLDEPVSG